MQQQFDLPQVDSSMLKEVMLDNPTLKQESEVNSIFDAVGDPNEEQLQQLQGLGAAMQDHMIKGDLNASPVMPNAFYKKRQTLVKDHHVGRNDECPCGSGKKYKNCCLNEGTYETYHVKK